MDLCLSELGGSSVERGQVRDGQFSVFPAVHSPAVHAVMLGALWVSGPVGASLSSVRSGDSLWSVRFMAGTRAFLTFRRIWSLRAQSSCPSADPAQESCVKRQQCV